MNLEILPERTGSAAENMAVDFLLLQRYPHAAVPRFRHYGWRRPAFTFGYAQKIAFVRAQLPPEGPFDLCRRPTGGGLVDHRDDWTYALVLPRDHPLEELRASQSYRAVHEALAGALRTQGVPARLSEPKAEAETSAVGICFERAEIADVVHGGNGAKIAGAAQKRNKHGLLFQGSIAKAATGVAIDWDGFGETFIARLAATLDSAPLPTPWPEFNDEEVEGLTEQYSAIEWIEQR
ncbi:MAG: lipoate--protein ligase family protein [Opitutaceae bacterium]|nr:lipoate--protein ligase family protein [Opitutaceae bacterium]